MKKLLSLALTFAMLFTSTVFAVPTAVTPESAEEAVVETPSDEKAAELTASAVTATPGLNIFTGTTGVWDFENATDDDIAAVFSGDNQEIATLSVSEDPLDATKKSFAMTTKTAGGENGLTGTGQGYPQVYFDIVNPIEKERPLFVTYKYYRYNPGIEGTTYTKANCLWLMRGGAVEIDSSNHGTNGTSWNTCSKYQALTKHSNATISTLYFQFNMYNTDTTATTMFIDDLAIIPAYAITYMNEDGTEYKKEYVNGVNSAGEATNAAHTLIADGPLSADNSKAFIGWSTKKDGTTADIVDEIVISGNADFVLYPVYGDMYRSTNGADAVAHLGELVYYVDFDKDQYDVESGYLINVDYQNTSVFNENLYRPYTNRSDYHTFVPEAEGSSEGYFHFEGIYGKHGTPNDPYFATSNYSHTLPDGYYYAAMDMKIPQTTTATKIINQLYNEATGYCDNGDLGYTAKMTLLDNSTFGNWVTYVTPAFIVEGEQGAGKIKANFSLYKGGGISETDSAVDYDNLAIYYLKNRTITLDYGNGITETVLVKGQYIDLTLYNDPEKSHVTGMLKGWEKADGTIIDASETQYYTADDETLTAVYESRYLSDNAAELVNSLGVPVKLVFFADFNELAEGNCISRSNIFQDQSNIVDTEYFTDSMATRLYTGYGDEDTGYTGETSSVNNGRTNYLKVIEDDTTGNKYFEASHRTKISYPPAVPRFYITSGAPTTENYYFFAMADVNLPDDSIITKLSCQIYDTTTIGNPVAQENGASASFYTLSDNEKGDWVTFKTNIFNIKSDAITNGTICLNFSPQYSYNKDTDEAGPVIMSFDNFSIYAIVPRTLTFADSSSEITVYDIEYDFTQSVPTSDDPSMTFSGWITQDGEFIPKTTSSYVVKEDLTLTEVWTQFASSDIDFSKYGTMVMLQDFNQETVQGNYDTLADSNGKYVPSASDLFIDKTVWNYGGLTHWWGTGGGSYNHSTADASGNRYMTSNGANSADHNNPSFRSNRNEPFNKVGAYYAVLDMRIPETNEAVYMVNQIHNRYQTNTDSQIADYAEQYEQYRPSKEPDGVTDKKGDSSKWMKLDASHKNGQWQTFITEPYIVREGQAVPHVGYNFGLVYPDGMIYSTEKTTFDMDNYAIFYLPNRTVNFNVEVNTAGITTALVEGITLNLANYTPVTVPEGKVFQGWSETDGGAIIAGNRIDIAPDGDGKTFYAVYADEAAPKLDKTEMRVRGVQGIRTVAKLPTEKQILDNVEFGFIVTRQAKLGEIAPNDFTIDCGLTEGSEYIKGVSFQRVNQETLKSVIVEYVGTDDMLTFAGVFKGVPDNMVDDVLVFRPYIKEGDTYTYGAVVQASVRNIAEQIYGGHTNYSFSLLDDETKAYIKKVINTPKA